MAGRQYSLGGFGGQLSVDDLERARAGVAGLPYAPQEPQAQPEPPDMSVQRAPGRPLQQIRAYSDADLADKNAQIALAARSGAAEAAGADRRAELRTQQADAQRKTNDQARADVEETRAHKKGLQGQQDKLLEEMRANIEPPSRSAGERVWGVLGGILAMASQGRAAAGVQIISQLATSGREERWAQAQHARSALYQAVTRGIDLDNATEEQQLEVARRMGAADALYWDNAIEAEKEKGMSGAMKRAAENVQLDLRQKARGLLRQDAEQDAVREAAAKKAAGAAQRSRREEYFWSIPLEELRAMPSNVLSKDGAKVLAERTKQDQGYRSGEEEIAAKQQKNAAGPSANLSADERKVQRLLTGVAPAVRNLRAMVANGEAPPHPYTEYAPDILTPEKTLNEQADMSAVADILLRDESGAAIGKDEQQKKLRGWGVTSGDPEVRRRGLEKMLSEYDARLGSVGGAGSGGPAGGTPPPARDPRVRSGFVAPDASERGVTPAAPRPGGVSPSFQLPQAGGVSLEDIRRAQQRLQAIDQGVPLAWVR